jgi:hypothetical protein
MHRQDTIRYRSDNGIEVLFRHINLRKSDRVPLEHVTKVLVHLFQASYWLFLLSLVYFDVISGEPERQIHRPGMEGEEEITDSSLKRRRMEIEKLDRMTVVNNNITPKSREPSVQPSHQQLIAENGHPEAIGKGPLTRASPDPRLRLLFTQIDSDDRGGKVKKGCCDTALPCSVDPDEPDLHTQSPSELPTAEGNSPQQILKNQ